MLTFMCRAIASLAVTLPSVYYLMQPQIERIQHPEKHGHGGHGGHDEHGEEGDGDEEGGSSEGGESGEEKSEDQDEGEQGEGGEKHTPSISDDEISENTVHENEGGQDVEGVQFKGATSGGTEEGEQGDTRKHIPDAKGFNKKRIESDYGGKQGEAQDPEQDPSDKDMAAASKPVGDMTTQSGKQEGLSNTDTKHSTNITDNPEKSTKGDNLRFADIKEARGS
ncbi:MAG: hypothetical protein ASARMPRED_001414 [Alectoria sarmentosa]|nr:MAG: hypothetical protein ASARMPRED_001414 [Alectoria sarmentosa]